MSVSVDVDYKSKYANYSIILEKPRKFSKNLENSQKSKNLGYSWYTIKNIHLIDPWPRNWYDTTTSPTFGTYSSSMVSALVRTTTLSVAIRLKNWSIATVKPLTKKSNFVFITGETSYKLRVVRTCKTCKIEWYFSWPRAQNQQKKRRNLLDIFILKIHPPGGRT